MEKHFEGTRKACSFLARIGDVSYSGHCGDQDKVGGELCIGLTAQHELEREIGFLAADPREILFTRSAPENTHRFN